MKQAISNELFYFDKEGVKPMIWNRVILNETIKENNLNKIYDELIDPRLIYIDKDLSFDQVEICNINSNKLYLFFYS